MNISAINDRITIYFGTDEKQINAYSLASSLVAFADAIKATNRQVNPGYDIEVVVEALSGGSFKATIRTLYRPLENLWSKEPVRNIVLGVVASALWDVISPKPPQVVINNNVVVVSSECGEITMPKEVFDAKNEAKKNSQVQKAFAQVVEVLKEDRTVKTIGFQENQNKKPELQVAVQDIPPIEFRTEHDDSVRIIYENTTLEILKAILERGSKKWGFVWGGNQISASVRDDRFYDEFFKHHITIAPGDELQVQLKITQEKKRDIGVWVNKTFEVVEVYKHIPQVRQTPLPL